MTASRGSDDRYYDRICPQGETVFHGRYPVSYSVTHLACDASGAPLHYGARRESEEAGKESAS